MAAKHRPPADALRGRSQFFSIEDPAQALPRLRAEAHALQVRGISGSGARMLSLAG